MARNHSWLTRGKQNYVEQVLLLRTLQSFVLAEHDWLDSDYFEWRHEAYSEFYLSGPSLDTVADVDNKALSMRLHWKATAQYLLFPPVHSPNHIIHMDNTHESDYAWKGSQRTGAGDVEDVAAFRLGPEYMDRCYGRPTLN